MKNNEMTSMKHGAVNCLSLSGSDIDVLKCIVASPVAFTVDESDNNHVKVFNCTCSSHCGSNFSRTGSCTCSSNCGSNYGTDAITQVEECREKLSA